ncbi:chalcone isomerase family protein [Shewanella gelidii]|uniref:Chalcone isomerase domain-containing protein n=1 Tax=Shewanella gelidii TaxID=1642821 RepID=A0A917JJ08_9GAMM|nr:chalcone isomerase family protein [Shewanella gelidii]MCL1096734.1 chalcone isomerase family protein [Shewanella gelidii]GGI69813.1 hypothetical protein GCM10009332_03680 [Shewanella gelidii]
MSKSQYSLLYSRQHQGVGQQLQSMTLMSNKLKWSPLSCRPFKANVAAFILAIISTVACLLLSFPVKSDDANNFNDIASENAHFSDAFSTFVEVGNGEMNWWWLSLYRARLLTPTGQYQDGETPLLLTIEYHRNIASEHLVEATQAQWQHLGFSQQLIEAWGKQIHTLWPDVTKHDQLSFHISETGQGRFYFNHRPLQGDFSAAFSRAFVSIWLAEQTSRPELRAQLLGQK